MRELVARNLRWLVRRPAYTLSVVTAMSLGLALLAIVVAACSAFLWRPLGVGNADELVRIRELKPGGGTGIESTLSVSPAAFHLWRQQPLPFSGIALSAGTQLSLTDAERPERLTAAAVSSNLFEVLEITPQIGRGFAEGEDQAGRDAVVVLSHDFWRQRFDASPAILGRVIELDGTPRTVIGVMPAGFSYPYDAKVWIPEVLGDTVNEPGQWSYNVIGRVAAGMTVEEAAARMSEIAARITEQRPDVSHAPGVHLREFRLEILDGLDRLLIILLASSAFVVLVSTLNAANITLARGINERRDDAVRLALGSGFGSLYGNALARAVTVCAISTVLAFLLARFATLPFSGLRGLSALDQFPTEMRLDVAAVLITLAVAAAAALVISLGAIWPQRRNRLHDALGGSSKGIAGAERSPLMSGLTVVQIAMSLVLLLGAVLVGGAYRQLMNQDRGFEDRNLLAADVTLAPQRYPDATSKERFLEAALAEIEAIPGVRRASSATTTPALAGTWGAVFNVEGQPPPEPRGYHITSHRFISDDYFETLGIPLVAGRHFDSRDHVDGVQHIIVSRRFAERFWPGESAIGKRVRRGDRDSDVPWFTIVGVSENVLEAGESELWDKRLQWYLPTSLGTDYDFAGTFLLVSTEGPVPGINAAIREAVWSVDPIMGIAEVAPIRSLMADTFERERYSAMLFGMFGVVALVISIVGLYGFLAFKAALRMSEFGIRMAMGARPAQLRLGVLADSAKLFATGLLLAAPLAWLLVRGVKSSLYGIESSGAREFALIVVVLLAVSLAASLLPASRAARVDPMKALRTE